MGYVVLLVIVAVVARYVPRSEKEQEVIDTVVAKVKELRGKDEG